ncbi:MAG TPA: ribose-phosphate pyrophosphokinase [Kofleriaceae bacterium]|nr:ribose-phosphate pyrophosphokinase [Kofleriaceae bacterium]
MVVPIIVSAPGSEDHAARLGKQLNVPVAELEVRRFPDGEFYCRLHSDMRGRDVIVVSTLDNPTDKFLLVAFLAETARDLGAKRVGLVAPYLSFMRQDIRFHPGEGITSVYFAKLMSSLVDWLVTVDPHLHRHPSLAPLYKIPTAIARAAPAIGAWVKANVASPILIGPDAESAQWVSVVAKEIGAPHVVLEKIRRGDRDVSISQPNVVWGERTPVIIDDIISTGRTMLGAVEQVVAQGAPAPICIGIHAVFADAVQETLMAAGASSVISCNTIKHGTNAICVSQAVADTTRALMRAN